MHRRWIVCLYTQAVKRKGPDSHILHSSAACTNQEMYRYSPHDTRAVYGNKEKRIVEPKERALGPASL